MIIFLQCHRQNSRIQLRSSLLTGSNIVNVTFKNNDNRFTVIMPVAMVAWTAPRAQILGHEFCK